MPMSNDGCAQQYSATSSNAGQGTMTLADVTTPRRAASKVAALTACASPRSSAWTTSVRAGPDPAVSIADGGSDCGVGITTGQTPTATRADSQATNAIRSRCSV